MNKVLIAAVVCVGCGGAVRISPESATADHASVAPGNTAVFNAEVTCPATAPCAREPAAAWTTSDDSVADLSACSLGGVSCTVVCRKAGAATIQAAAYGDTAEARLTCR